MAITIQDCMSLPSLHLASVIAGHGGLSKTVDSISVLEWIDLTDNQTQYFFNNEIVITSFYALRGDVDAQIKVIEQLHQSGEVGLILFYVGRVLPKVHQRLIDIANTLDFAIIQMPQNHDDLRYSEVIMEIAGLIHQDLTKETDLVKYTMERLVSIPEKKHDFTTLLRIVSDRLKVSILLSDDAFTDCIFSPWPRMNSSLFPAVMAALTEDDAVDRGIVIQDIKEMYNLKWPLAKLVFISTEGQPIKGQLIDQAVQIIQLTSRLWGLNERKNLPYELFYAIIHNETIRTAQIAKVIRYDISRCNHLIMIRLKHPDAHRLTKLYQCVRKQLNLPHDSYILTQLEDHIIVLTTVDKPSEIVENLDDLKGAYQDIRLFYAPNLNGVGQIHTVYHRCIQYYDNLMAVFPRTRRLANSQLSVVVDCLTTEPNQHDVLVNLLSTLRGDVEMATTLACYFLDANQSKSLTARYLVVHPNTVKYRLARAAQILNVNMSSTADVISLYRALIYWRLSESSV